MAHKNKQFRVALMGIYHESNTFIERKTTLEDFQKSHLLRGVEIVTEYRTAYHEIGGMLEVMDRAGIEVVPLLFAEATPGGTVAAEAYESLHDELTARLQEVLPVDGCLVVPHGAGVSETEPDMDGHWLGSIRKMVGANVPIVGTLDPHANVSDAMVAATDALVAYRTNPHVDQRETGKAAGELMVRCLMQAVRPLQYLSKPPVTISIEQQHTSMYPCTLLYDEADGLRRREGVLSVSVLLGFPYADVAEMGTAFLVVTDGDVDGAASAAVCLEQLLVTHRRAFVGKLQSIAEQLAEIPQVPKPVLWLDMGDNVGGGAIGDSTVLLQALEGNRSLRGFGCIYDPNMVSRCWGHAPGDQISLSLGNDYGRGTSGYPFTFQVELHKKVSGQFREDKPRHGGQVQYDMGDTVIVQTATGNTVMIHSLRVPPFSLSQLTTFGLDPEGFDVLIAKGVNAPIAAYGPVCRTIMQANTPGVTQADMTGFAFKHRRKPLYPFEELS